MVTNVLHNCMCEHYLTDGKTLSDLEDATFAKTQRGFPLIFDSEGKNSQLDIPLKLLKRFNSYLSFCNS